MRPLVSAAMDETARGLGHPSAMTVDGSTERPGKFLRGARVTAGFSRAVLAKRARIKPGRLGRLERDESRPRVEELKRIRQALGLLT